MDASLARTMILLRHTRERRPKANVAHKINLTQTDRMVQEWSLPQCACGNIKSQASSDPFQLRDPFFLFDLTNTQRNKLHLHLWALLLNLALDVFFYFPSTYFLQPRTTRKSFFSHVSSFLFLFLSLSSIYLSIYLVILPLSLLFSLSLALFSFCLYIFSYLVLYGLTRVLFCSARISSSSFITS